MRNTSSLLVTLLAISMLAGICTGADHSTTNEPLQEITKAHKQTVERVRELQDYKPSPEELAANAIRVEKYVTMSEKTRKIKMVSYRTFRGDRLIKEYIERDTNDDGESDLFMEMFRAGAEVCVALSRSTVGPVRGSTVHVHGMTHVTADLIGNDSDGKYVELLLMQEDGRFIDRFRRDIDGLLQPVSADEYLKTMRTAEAVAPFIGAVTDVIDSAKENKREAVPNKAVEPTPNR